MYSLNIINARKQISTSIYSCINIYNFYAIITQYQDIIMYMYICRYTVSKVRVLLIGLFSVTSYVGV